MGKFEMYWYERITTVERDILTHLGFKVYSEQSDGRNGILTKIEW